MGKQDLYNAITAGDVIKVKDFFKSASKEDISSAMCSEIEGSNILQYILNLQLKEKRGVNVQIFQKVLKHCNNDLINKADKNRQFPLFLAVQAGPEFVSLFKEHALNRGKIQQDVNWRIVDNESHGLLYHAIMNVYDNNVNVQLNDIVFNENEFPYHLATKGVDDNNILHQIFTEYQSIDGRQLRIQLLLDRLNNFQDKSSIWYDSLNPKVLLNARNKYGDTPFHLFIKNGIGNTLFSKEGQGAIYSIERLFEHCDLLKCDGSGNTAINLAFEKGDKLLIKHILQTSGDKEQEELKYALIENLNEENYAILESNNMLGDLSEDALQELIPIMPKLAQRIEKGYAKLDTLDKCEKYHELVNKLSDTYELNLDLNLTKCAVKSQNLVLLKFLKEKNLLEQDVFVNEVVKVKNPNFIKEVLPVVGLVDALDLFGRYAPEVSNNIRNMSLEMTFEMLGNNVVERRTGLVLNFIDMLTNNVGLFDSIVEEATPGQLENLMNTLVSVNSKLSEYRLSSSSHLNDIDLYFENTKVLRDKLESLVFKFVENGEYDKVAALINGNKDLVYSERNGKNLLEVVSDSGNTELVKHLISVHNEFIKKGRLEYSINQDYTIMQEIKKSLHHIAKINHEDVISILSLNEKFIDQLTRDGHGLVNVILNSARESNNQEVTAYCYETYSSLLSGTTAPLHIYLPKIRLPRDITAKRLEDDFSMDRVGEFGIFAKYIQGVQNPDADVFKREVVDKLSDNVKEYATRSHGDRGHSIFTITAAFGTPEHWKKLSTGYRSVSQVKRIKSIFPNDPLNGNKVSTICSPLQSAVMAYNEPMIDFLLKNIEPSELTRRYGKDNNNVLHTILDRSQVLLLESVINHSRFPISVLTEALLQPNAHGITPFGKACESKNTRVCRDFVLRAKEQMKVSQLQDLILNENFVKAVVESGDVTLLKEVLGIERYVNELKPKQRICFAKHKIGNDSLLVHACKCGNTRFLEDLMECYDIKDLTSSLTEVIRAKSEITPEILSTFMSHIVYSASETEVLEEIVSCVVECDNSVAFKILDEMQAINPADRNAYFTVGSAIKNGTPNILEYLLNAQMQDFKPVNSGLEASELGIALCSPKFSEVCYNYLKTKPQDFQLDLSVVPHGAILSNNLELLKHLIERDSSFTKKKYDFSASYLKEVGSKLEEHYDCELIPFESLCDFARRENASAEIQDYLELSLLKSSHESLEKSYDITVDNDLMNAMVKHMEYVSSSCPLLTKYVVDKFDADNLLDGVHYNIDSLLSNSDPEKNNIFHLCTEENAEFLSIIAKKCYTYAVETGKVEYKDLITNMVNHINPSNGLSFFHFLALNSDYRSYENVKSSCGNIKLLTADKAHLAHLCAKSGIKDENGKFEFQNLIESDPTLVTAVDAQKRGLTVYAASSQGKDVQVRDEAVKLITSLGEKLDGNLKKYSRNYIKKTLVGAFSSGNRGIYKFLSKLASEKGYTVSQQRSDLFHEIESTSDPVKKGELLIGEYKLYSEESAETRVLPAESHGESGAQEGREEDKETEEKAEETLLDDENIEEETLLEEGEIIISRAKKEILDFQNEIKSLIIDEADMSEYVAVLDKIDDPVAVLQFKPLSKIPIAIAEDAFLNNNIALIQALLNSSRKLNPNITDANGNTLLHNFAMFINNNPELLSNKTVQSSFSMFLQNHGFSLNQKNNFGNTPLDILEKTKAELNDKAKLKDSDIDKGVVNAFMNSLAVLSENERISVKRFDSARGVFVKRGSIYNLSSEVAKSKVLQARFNDILYKTCVDILSDDSSKYDDVSQENFGRLKQILNDSALKKTLLNTDSTGNNVLQKLCLDVASKKVDGNNEKLLELFSGIVSHLEKSDPVLLQDLLFNHRNSKYENTIESLAHVPGAYSIFKKLEMKFNKHKISDYCDFHTMLVNAAGAGSDDLYKYLCSNYAIDNINNVDLSGNSSLHKAVTTGSHDMVNAVLMTGSNINRKNKHGNTPLHELLIFIASAQADMVQPGHIDLVKFLVSRGASLSAKNHCGHTPIDIVSYIDKSKKLDQLSEKPINLLDSIVESRKDYYNIKKQCITELKPYVKLGQSMSYQDVKFSVYGGILSAKINDGKLKSSDLLNSRFCQENGLQSVKFQFSDNDKGYVQSIDNKRNYVVTDGSIKLKVSWQPVRPKGSKRQVVNVIIGSDGSISLSDEDAKKYGMYGEKINFDCCKIYVGGLCLKDVLANGKWRNKEFDLGEGLRKNDTLDPTDLEDRGQEEDYEIISQHSTQEAAAREATSELSFSDRGSEYDEYEPIYQDVDEALHVQESSGVRRDGQGDQLDPEFRSDMASKDSEDAVKLLNLPILKDEISDQIDVLEMQEIVLSSSARSLQIDETDGAQPASIPQDELEPKTMGDSNELTRQENTTLFEPVTKEDHEHQAATLQSIPGSSGMVSGAVPLGSTDSTMDRVEKSSREQASTKLHTSQTKSGHRSITFFERVGQRVAEKFGGREDSKSRALGDFGNIEKAEKKDSKHIVVQGGAESSKVSKETLAETKLGKSELMLKRSCSESSLSVDNVDTDSIKEIAEGLVGVKGGQEVKDSLQALSPSPSPSILHSDNSKPR